MTVAETDDNVDKYFNTGEKFTGRDKAEGYT